MNSDNGVSRYDHEQRKREFAKQFAKLDASHKPLQVLAFDVIIFGGGIVIVAVFAWICGAIRIG